MYTRKRQSGFTIVELLIVIVVIAILAAVTIVAYNGITSRATAASLQTDLEGAAKTLENDRTVSSTSGYPTALSAANGGKGLPTSTGEVYQYTVDNTTSPQTYCLTVAKGLTSYYVNQTGAIQQGYCSGQVGPADNTAVVMTFAGSGTPGTLDATGTSAQFSSNAIGVAVDSSGNIYVADTGNNRIRKITSGGVVSTLAGSTSGSTNGTGTGAKFNNPNGVAVDSSGNVFVADKGNNLIRKITSGGVVTTFADINAVSDADGASHNVTDIAIAPSGDFYITDNNKVRKISPTGTVTAFVGSLNGNVDGTGTAAQFKAPNGLIVDSTGTIYVADTFNNTIRKVTSGGVVTTLAGSTQGYVDGTGTGAQFYSPFGIAVDPAGTLFVTDTYNHRIRKITSSGVVTSLAGSGGSGGYADGTGTGAQFFYPFGVATNTTGTVYINDTGNARVRKILIP